MQFELEESLTSRIDVVGIMNWSVHIPFGRARVTASFLHLELYFHCIQICGLHICILLPFFFSQTSKIFFCFVYHTRQHGWFATQVSDREAANSIMSKGSASKVTALRHQTWSSRSFEQICIRAIQYYRTLLPKSASNRILNFEVKATRVVHERYSFLPLVIGTFTA